MGKSTINGQFSMAMLVYQRVYGGLYETENLPDRPSQKGKTMDVYQLLKIFQRTVDIDHMNHLFLTFDPPSYVCCFIHEKILERTFIGLINEQKPIKNGARRNLPEGVGYTPSRAKMLVLGAAFLTKSRGLYIHSCRGPKYPN